MAYRDGIDYLGDTLGKILGGTITAIVVAGCFTANPVATGIVIGSIATLATASKIAITISNHKEKKTQDAKIKAQENERIEAIKKEEAIKIKESKLKQTQEMLKKTVKPYKDIRNGDLTRAFNGKPRPVAPSSRLSDKPKIESYTA